LTPVTSLAATNWFQSARKHGDSLRARARSLAGTRGWSPRFLALAGITAAIAFLVFLAVIALIVSWSAAWAILLVPYGAAVAGMVKELRVMRLNPPEPAMAAPARRPARKTAARKPAAPKPAVQK
jgi:hypothetical protein